MTIREGDRVLLDAALGTGRGTLENGMQVTPAVAIYRGPILRSIVIAPCWESDRRAAFDRAWEMLAMASLVGADRCCWLLDGFERVVPIDAVEEIEMPPSEDPEAHDALVAILVQRGVRTVVATQAYGRGDDGTLWFAEADYKGQETWTSLGGITHAAMMQSWPGAEDDPRVLAVWLAERDYGVMVWDEVKE